MGPFNIKLGEQTGEHGSYIFYKSFQYMRKGKWRTVQLGRFFFVRVSKGGPICVGELQLAWTGRHSSHPLASVKLYYLPEQIPDGRQPHHGQDELIATEKVVLHVEDLIKWIIFEGVEWTMGRYIPYNKSPCQCFNKDLLSCNVQIISFPKYCRLRAIIKRLEMSGENVSALLTDPTLNQLTGVKVVPNSYVMFSKETFDNPELENHEFRCDHLAPNLKGRPRKKPKTKPEPSKVKEESKEDNESEIASVSSGKEQEKKERQLRQVLGSRMLFTKAIYKHMKEMGSPITKLPSLGFKKVDLYLFFKHAHSLGGYHEISQKRLWKHLYDRLGGNPTNTSAASCTKRQYERLVLSFETHIMAGLQHGRDFTGKTGEKTNTDGVKAELVKAEGIKREKNETEVIKTEIKEEDVKAEPRVTRSNRQRRSVSTDSVSNTSDMSCKPKEEPQPCTEVPDTVNSALSFSSSAAPATTTAPAALTVAASKTWSIPKSETPPASNASESKADLDIIEVKTVLKKDVIASKCTKLGRLDTLPQGTDEKQPQPAHRICKAPMPLHVLGPCLPWELTPAQQSPWKPRLDSRHSDPNKIFTAGSYRECIHDLKRRYTDPTVVPMDLSVKRRRVVPPAHSKTGYRTPTISNSGAIDLSMKSETPSDEPINYTRRPRRQTGSLMVTQQCSNSTGLPSQMSQPAMGAMLRMPKPAHTSSASPAHMGMSASQCQVAHDGLSHRTSREVMSSVQPAHTLLSHSQIVHAVSSNNRVLDTPYTRPPYVTTSNCRLSHTVATYSGLPQRTGTFSKNVQKAPNYTRLTPSPHRPGVMTSPPSSQRTRHAPLPSPRGIVSRQSYAGTVVSTPSSYENVPPFAMDFMHQSGTSQEQRTSGRLMSSTGGVWYPPSHIPHSDMNTFLTKEESSS